MISAALMELVVFHKSHVNLIPCDDKCESGGNSMVTFSDIFGGARLPVVNLTQEPVVEYTFALYPWYGGYVWIGFLFSARKIVETLG